jgi:hypothetical protein
MRPIEIELLQDALRRKQPLRVGTSIEKAHEVIINNGLRSPLKRAHIKGMLAEALYLQRNPEWEYVKSPTAPQVDVFKRVPGGRPIGAQIKTHMSPDPMVYAREMLEDHRAARFLVPDDHVDRLSDLWRERIRQKAAAGAVEDAAAAQKQLNRIGRLGFTSGELDDSFSRALRHAVRERNSSYVSLGAGLAMAIGPGLWQWWQTGPAVDPAQPSVGRATSILAVERATTWSLARVGNGSLRGGLRGNLISGVVILATDGAWTMFELGGSTALGNPEFYASLAGDVSGIALAVTVGGMVTTTATIWTAPVFGVWAPAVGGFLGLASATVAGTIGYIGGDFAIRQILTVFRPDIFYAAEDDAIKLARDSISNKVTELQQATSNKS